MSNTHSNLVAFVKFCEGVSVPHTAAHVYTDRPIYKPGQTVNYKAIIRQDDDALLDMIPTGTEVEVIVRDARNQYRTTAAINGRPVQVLVDTGANVVALSAALD